MRFWKVPVKVSSADATAYDREVIVLFTVCLFFVYPYHVIGTSNAELVLKCFGMVDAKTVTFAMFCAEGSSQR